MSNFRENLIENYKDYLIGLDDTFAFKCRSCGKCCKDREDIMLTTRDLFNIAKKLNISMKDAVATYCENYIGKGSRIPIVRLMPLGKNRVCPLLNDGRCMVHDVKPVVCAMFPIGRAIINELSEDETLTLGFSDVQYIINPITCGSVKSTQTVRRWLERYNIPVEDEFFIKWNETISILSKAVMYFEDTGISELELDLLWDGIYCALYIKYDPKQDLMPQFIENSISIQEMTTELIRVWDVLQPPKKIEPSIPTPKDA